MAKNFNYDEVPVVETTGGRLKGFLYEGAYIYRGVPYAYADRFQMPEETSWEGVKDATSYGFVCAAFFCTCRKYPDCFFVCKVK